ncbi:hypothetical protein [Labilibaculum sp.]|uniref:hypothetical protein n=1 Tax=Labilibaculum sp. TaxID=2060723 RepID=UPI003561A2D5
MKALLIILSSTWKFAATFPLAVYVFQMSFFETILYTNIGGLIGILISTLASKGLIKLFNAYGLKLFKSKKKIKKKFNKQNRRLVILKNKYGLAGIAILTPVLLSIPIGVFLNTKYYGHKKISYLYLLISQITWSFVYTLFYTAIKVSM